MAAGDIESAAAQIWTLVDNSSSALSIDATGKTGILKIITTDAGEGVAMSGTLSVTGHVTMEGITSTGATGTGKFVFDNAPTISGHPTIEGITSTGAIGTGKFVFDTSPTVTGLSSNTVLVGANANFTRFPSAVAVVSTVAANQQNETGNIGLIAEAVGAGATRNAGLYGVGYTSGSYSCQGVVGEGHVSATGDTAPSVGVRGYANDIHVGGTNVGIYADASGSAIANYALYLNSGDIISASSKIWTVVDNTASALSFDATGKTGILVVNTADAAEGVTMSGTLSVTGNVGIGNTPSGTYKLEVTGTIAATAISNTRINPRVVSITSAATITPAGDTCDQYEVTALAVGATIAAPSGTPVDGQKIILRIKDNGTAQSLTWTTTSGAYREIVITLPTSTVISKVVYVGCVYNSQDTFWDVIAVAQQA
jgi:hypothetical protein